MKQPAAEAAPPDQWTLIRGARQLLTLRGASGPRRGSAMADLAVIPDGAILIRNGIIEKIGSSRQVENSSGARVAREIDAAGGIVMPAFVDPDIALATPVSGPVPDRRAAVHFDEPDIRRMSRRRLEEGATTISAELVRYGILSIGSHTLFANDLRSTVKALRLHKSMQNRPIRIRSLFSPPWLADDAAGNHFNRVSDAWMPIILQKQLSSVLEVPVAAQWVDESHALAAAGAACGFNLRMRVSGVQTESVMRLACAAGSIAILGVLPESSAAARALADMGCVQVALAANILAGKSTSARGAVDDGMPLALASGYRHDAAASYNPQFLLHLACQNLCLRPEEAIVAATYNAACSLRLSHVTGSLELGKQGDICVMDVDDYRELVRRAGHHDVKLVLRSGKIVYRRAGLVAE